MSRQDFATLYKNIISNDLCTNCGTCMGICPSKCIVFQEEKIKKNGECIGCGQCVKVCPGGKFDYNECSKELYNKDYDSSKWLGTYRKILAGHSTDNDIRNNAGSGGIITELSLYMLQNKIVDGIVTIRQKKGKQYNYEPCIAYDIETVKKSAQSKYTLIPTNSIISTILKNEGKYAFIGLPCQIHGIRKAMRENEILRKRIVFIVGIFCGFNMYASSTDYLIKKSGINKANIKELSYRKKSDGDTGFFVDDGIRSKFIKKHEYTYLNLFYSPKRCQLCYDYSAEFADVAVGDAWEYGLGWSRIIVRSKKAEELVENLLNEKRIQCVKSSAEDIKNSQKKILYHKKRDIWYRWDKKKNIPEICIGERPQYIKTNWKGKFQFYIMELGGTKVGRFLLGLIPFALLRKVSSTLRK